MISGAGICVVLPIVGLNAGWFTSIWVSLVIGFVSYYTARLIVTHLGKGHTVKECILQHFNNDYRFMQGYCVIIWFNEIIQEIIYFRILCLQIEGILGYKSSLVGPLAAIGLLTILLAGRLLHFC